MTHCVDGSQTPLFVESLKRRERRMKSEMLVEGDDSAGPARAGEGNLPPMLVVERISVRHD